MWRLVRIGYCFCNDKKNLVVKCVDIDLLEVVWVMKESEERKVSDERKCEFFWYGWDNW